MEFKKGDIVIITFPLNFESHNDFKEEYEGSAHEVLEIDDMGWVKISSEDEFKWKWLPPGYVRHYKPEQDELIELVDLSDIMS